jgi:hypothetical protein
MVLAIGISELRLPDEGIGAGVKNPALRHGGSSKEKAILAFTPPFRVVARSSERGILAFSRQ